MPLAEARRKHDDAKKLLAAGVNPSEQKKIEKFAAVASNQNTFGAVGRFRPTKGTESAANWL